MMKNDRFCLSMCFCLAFVFTLTESAFAESYEVMSVEWLTDLSELVSVVRLDANKNPEVKELLKSNEFETTKDEWMEVRVPLKRFQATSFGRIVKTAGPVNPEQVSSIGFLLADKQAGPFRLEVDWSKSEASAVN